MKNLIDFAEVDKYGPQELSRPLSIAVHDLDREEVVTLGDVVVSVRVAKGDLEREYLVDGNVTYTADLDCSRCLEPYAFANDSPFALRYRPQSAAPDLEGLEAEITPDELDIEFYTEPRLSLVELGTEQIQLSLPMKPLCGDNCQGLCRTCGENLNRGACSCSEVLRDPRWSGLKDVREQLISKKDI